MIKQSIQWYDTAIKVVVLKVRQWILTKHATDSEIFLRIQKKVKRVIIYISVIHKVYIMCLHQATIDWMKCPQVSGLKFLLLLWFKVVRHDSLSLGNLHPFLFAAFWALWVKHWIRLQQVFRFSTFHAYCRVCFTWVIGFLYIAFAWDIFSHKHFLRNFSVRMTILGDFFEGWSTNVHEGGEESF